MEYIFVFLAGFFQLALKTLNILNTVNKRYVWIFFTCFVITLVWAYGAVAVVTGTVYHVLTFALGCACGAVFSAYFETKIFRRKK